jgi:CDGSH-type Zn-finger protein
MPVTITAKKNGPYRVDATGGAEIRVVDADGKAFDLQGKAAFSLCRCGHSANKPFCDGSHGKIGFQAEDIAPKVPES